MQFSAVTARDLPAHFVQHVRSVLVRVQAGAEKDRWPGGEGAPQLIVTLLRAAPLPFAVIRGCAEAHNIALPPVIGAHIGSEMFRHYGEFQGWTQGNSFMFLSADGREAYRAWLDGDRYAQTVIEGMRHDAKAAGVDNPHRIMIYDDFQSEFGTMFAARHLVSRAFPTADLESSVAMAEWYAIINKLLPELPLEAEQAKVARHFLYELAKGFRETPSGLAALDSTEQLRVLGHEDKYRKAHAYSSLANLYGEEELLGFSGRVREALKTMGATIDPTPIPPRKQVWLLTGGPGVDKRVVLNEALALISESCGDSGRPYGFITTMNGEGSGYDLLSLAGKRVPLAAVDDGDFDDPAPVTMPDGARLVVDRAAVEHMMGETLGMAFLGGALVIDEIGPLLMASDDFPEKLWQLLGYNNRVILGTVTAQRHPFIDRVKAHPAVELVEATAENRQRLPQMLAKRMVYRDPVPGLKEQIGLR